MWRHSAARFPTNFRFTGLQVYLVYYLIMNIYEELTKERFAGLLCLQGITSLNMNTGLRNGFTSLLGLLDILCFVIKC